MFSKRFSNIIYVCIFITSIKSEVVKNDEGDLKFFNVDNPMVEGFGKDYKPFYQDLKIKPRYLQGAYEHEIKISK
jgi:hypothetical protein